jgi:hypothetical protein
MCHEARRRRRRAVARARPLDERAYVESLESPELEQHVRCLVAVDRAVEHHRKIKREAA